MPKSFKLSVSRVISSLHSCRSVTQTLNPIPSLQNLPPINIATPFNGDDHTEKSLLYKRRDKEATDCGCWYHSDELCHTESTSASSLDYAWQMEEKWHVINKISHQTRRRKIDKSSVSTFSDEDESSPLLKLETKSRLRVCASSSLDTVLCFSTGVVSSPAPESSSIWPSPARLSSMLKPLMSCLVEGKVRESYAVVTKSENPLEDFRRSMMEMILEKQIYEQKELEQLLDCYVCLNSEIHHSTIFQAFSDILNDQCFTDSFPDFVW